MTDEPQERAQIIRRAAQDGLTGCLNRAAILDVLTTAVAGCSGAAGVAVLLFDLDRFKHIMTITATRQAIISWPPSVSGCATVAVTPMLDGSATTNSWSSPATYRRRSRPTGWAAVSHGQ